ncbi:hypothetical protein H9P43_000241 [Blastocladiella emersonii ATCC 22665]|nr:hypothetical protein H9P43_000241 [Blastocladiella emersonii ATCC 22665]
MPSSTTSVLATLLVLALAATHVAGHAILLFPEPRAGSNGPDNLGIKIPAPDDRRAFGTCGGTSPGRPTASLIAGRQTTLSWSITIDHLSDPGVSVAMRCNGQQQFQSLARGITAQDQKATVTIPASASGTCELQWIWTSEEDGGSYISCADVTVRSANGGGNNNGGGGQQRQAQQRQAQQQQQKATAAAPAPTATATARATRAAAKPSSTSTSTAAAAAPTNEGRQSESGAVVSSSTSTSTSSTSRSTPTVSVRRGGAVLAEAGGAAIQLMALAEVTPPPVEDLGGPTSPFPSDAPFYKN